MTRRLRFASAAALLLAASLVAGCGPRNETTANQAAPIAPYVSVETGFRFTPPDSWPPERYLVSELTGPAAAARQPGTLSIAEVQYQPVDLAHHPEVLLRIHVFPDSVWERLAHAAGSDSLGGVVARARGRTYLAATSQRSPYPDGSADGRAFQAMRLAISDVTRWLSVADAASDLASEFLPGMPAFGPAPVMYTGFLRRADTVNRRVKVIFRADSSALVSTETGSGGAVRNQRARWSLEGVYIRLAMLEDNGQPSGDFFVWAIRDSALSPVVWDRNRYGPVGLPLRLRP